MKLIRLLVLTSLVLAMAGFGVCALCGGVIGTQALLDAPHSGGRDIAWLAYGGSAIGLLLAWGCWWLWRRMRQPPAAGDAVYGRPPDDR